MEDVRHALVDIEFNSLTSLIERLIETDEAAEEDFFRTALDQGRRKPFREIAVDGRNIGVFVIFGVGVRKPPVSPAEPRIGFT